MDKALRKAIEKGGQPPKDVPEQPEPEDEDDNESGEEEDKNVDPEVKKEK